MTLRLAVLAGTLLAAGAPASAAEVAWRYQLDLRDLPASTRPAEVSAVVDARVAARAGTATLVSLAVNGIVVARRSAAREGPTVVHARIEDRLLSTRNSIEVSAAAPQCLNCEAALATARPVSAPRFRLEPPSGGATDFSQVVTRYRAGLAVRATSAEDRQLAALVKDALGPRAPADAKAKAVIHAGATPPGGVTPPLRFDLGPVRLVRSDGVEIASDDTLRRSTVVQLLRAGDRPLVWVRPGKAGAVPPELRLDEGDVALFDATGRTLEFSTKRDRAVRIAYGAGVDAYGANRTMELWRFGLLAFWLIATVFLAIVFRRLPRPQQSAAAA